VEECAPEEFRFALKHEGEAPVPELKECAGAIYHIAGEQGLEGKALFRAAYQALIGKDQGPRLANFLRSIHKERFLGILASY
jgi:lysyl-tRNA synthetase class 1